MAIVAVVAIGAWYAYCRYYPLLLTREGDSTSPDIVEAQYRFDDVNGTHLKAARQKGIEPVASEEKLDKKQLVKIESCRYYKVDELTHSVPYLVPQAKELVEEIGLRFQQALDEQGFERHRVIVTSVLRTGDDVKRLRRVNGNAAANSAHQYGTTFDITYIRFDRQSLLGKWASNQQLANILGNVLRQFRDYGRCYVKYERKQRCFHITSRR